MDFHMRFFENTANTLSTRCYNSEFLQKAAAVDMHQKFESCSKGLDANTMIQVFLKLLILFIVIIKQPQSTASSCKSDR